MIVKTAREELIRFKGKAIGLGVFSLLGTLGIVGQAWFFAVLIEKNHFFRRFAVGRSLVYGDLAYSIRRASHGGNVLPGTNGRQFGGAGQTRFAPKNFGIIYCV